MSRSEYPDLGDAISILFPLLIYRPLKLDVLSNKYNQI